MRGIGPWTAQYVVMRGLGDPDIFLDGDLGVKHALAALDLDSVGIRPLATVADVRDAPPVGNTVKETHDDDDDERPRQRPPTPGPHGRWTSPIGELTILATG